MTSVRVLTAALLLSVAGPVVAQQRADAVLLVNAQSPQYAGVHHVQAFLDHFGVPYTVLDISTTRVGADLASYALIIVGHPGLDTAGTYLDAGQQQAISAAVLGGTGLVSFDHDLANGTTGRYQFEDDVFGFGYRGLSSGESVTFTAEAPAHYITNKHAAGQSITLTQLPAALLTPPADAKVLVQYAGTSNPFVVARSYGLGRAVQWASSAWMAPQQHRYDYRGPLRGLDDVVWRSLVWAARKPFVMQGLPNFVTMRVDDAQGPFAWAHAANGVGLKPWIGTFYQRLIGDDWIDLARLTQDGNATSSVHSNGVDFFYYDHFTPGDLSSTTVAANFADATWWYNTYGVHISKVVVPHFYEIGTNVFGYLQSWGVKHVVTHMTPGQPYDAPEGWPAIDWLQLGPYRKWDAGSQGPGTAAAVTYADYLTVPGHPEFDRQFFDCVTEIRDDAGYEWFPDANDVAGTVGRGTRQVQRALDSMTLATLFTHEYFINGNGDVAPFTAANWQSALQQITANLAPYNPVYVTLDDACDYIKAKHDTKITSAVLDGTTLRATVSGRGEVPTQFMVFTDAAGFIHQESWDVPIYDGVQTISSTLPVSSAPTLTALAVTPSSATIVSGQTAQFTATATYSDGSSWAVTSSGAWSSSAPAVASVTAGLATGLDPGAADVEVSFAGSTATAHLTVTQAPLVITTSTLPVAAQRTPYSGTLSATGGRHPYAWSTTGTLPAGLALGADGVVSGTPTGRGTFTFPVTVTDAGSSSATATITLVINSSTDVSLWPTTAVPGTVDRGADSSLELGVKFYSETAGTITGVRFYKAAANTGIHTANLWDPPACGTCSPTLLGSAIFTGETGSGWQEVRFASPVAIDANKVYVASYHTDVGHYARDVAYFTGASRDSAPLHAPSAATVGGQGVYAYGASSTYPSEHSGVDPNYWVDVVFSAGDPASLATITIAPADPNVDVGTATRLAALGEFSDGATADISGQVVWMSSNPAVATVDPLGLVSALTPGTTTVTASHGGVTGSTTVTTTLRVASIRLTPSTARLVAGGTQQFTATALDGAGNAVTGYTFTWSATSGGTITSGGLFTAGATSGVFVSNVSASAAGVTGAASTETVAVASLALAPTSLVGGASATATVTLSGAAPAGGAVVALSSDTSGVTVPATVTFDPGAVSTTFAVATSVVGADTTATISATLGATATAALTVAPPPVAVAAVSVAPTQVTGGTGATGTITLNRAAPSGGVTVSLGTTNAAAAAVGATATVSEGATTATFPVTTSAVAADTSVTLSAVVGAGTTQTTALTVAAPRPAEVSFSPAAVTGSSTATSTGTVTLTGPAPAGGVTVALSSDSAAATVPASVTIAGGATSATFTAGTVAVPSSTAATVTASLNGGTASGALTVNPAAVSGLTLSTTVVVGGAAPTLTVRLSVAAPTAGAAVTLSSSNAAVASVPSTATVAGGATSTTVSVTTFPVAASTTVTLTATYQGSTRTVTLRVVPPIVTGIALNPSTLAGGASATATVTLNGASAGGYVVNLGSDNAAATVPATLTIPAGALSATFPVTTSVVSASASATITAVAATGGVTQSASLTIAKAALSSVTTNTSVIVGGRSITGTVTLTGNAPAGGLTVALSIDTAAASVPASVTVLANAKSRTFTISTVPVPSYTTATVTGSLDGVSRTKSITVAPPSVTGVNLGTSTLVGGTSTTGTVTVNGAAPAGGLTVQLFTNAPASVPATVIVPAGSLTSDTFTVSSTPVATSTSPVVSALAGSVTRTATVSVLAPTVASVSASPTSIQGGGAALGTVTLTGPAPSGGLTVTLASASPGVASVPASVAVPESATAATFGVATAVMSATTAVQLTATGGGASASTSLTVRGIAVASITTPASVTGGTPASITVTLTNPALPGGFTVQLYSDNAAASPPASATVNAGDSSVTVDVPTSSVGTTTNVTLTALGGSVSVTATMAISP